jgi:Caspase domain
MRALAWLTLMLALPTWAAERFAVVVGANRGGPTRAKLWYAEKDASRFAQTLRELGDFPEGNVVLLQGVTSTAVRTVWADIEAKVQRARATGQRTLLVFYFSGHAGLGSLELGDDHIDFSELKQAMENSTADVKVAIVDACESGGLTQVKGARPSQVDFVLPTDDTARGVAYIASTAAGEVAQESAAIGASFFTFHLEAALRGAGDANGDGLVSLNEAFHYTSSRTITGTSTTDVGPQHPTYNFRMAGRGDVVLSDLRHARARLTLPGSEKATWVISQQGRLVAEAPGGLTLALPAGGYHVEKREAGTASGGEVTLSDGQTGTVGPLSVKRVAARGKGGEGVLYQLAVGGGIDAPFLNGFGVAPGFRLSLRRGFGDFGVRGSLGYSDGTGSLAGNGGPTASRLQTGLLEVAGLWRPFDAQLFVDLGVELSAGWHTQSFDKNLRTAFSGGVTGTASLGLRLGPMTVELRGGVGVRAAPIDGEYAARLAGQVMLAAGVEL